MDRWKTQTIQCKGGLNTSTDILSFQPGEAAELINYEAGIFGGYRRISGYTPYDPNSVPLAGGVFTGDVLGVCVFNGTSSQVSGVIAARSDRIYFSTGSGWTQIDNGARSFSQNRYQFVKYLNTAGGRNVAMLDGTNRAAKWDGTTYTLINGTGAPTNPRYGTFFNSCLVLAGYTSGGGLQAFSMSAPNADTDFDGSHGAIEINVHDNIVGIRSFRAVLYIFCQRSIWQLTGNSISNYAISPVALGIGCLAWDSIQEVNGDLVYLSADGIRTLSGTMKLNDVELGDLSKPVIDVANAIYTNSGNNPEHIVGTIVRKKNQYRLFYHDTTTPASDSKALMGMIRPGKQTMTQFGTYISTWEWAELQGIHCTCADSDFISGAEVVVHGDSDGLVYQQEKGSSFNGQNIYSSYLTAPLQLEDSELRKLMQKLTVYLHVEDITSISAYVIFDFADARVAQPNEIILDTTGVQPQYGSAIYGSSTYAHDIFLKDTENIWGSGKMVQIQFTTDDTNGSHSIQGLTLQYRPLGRR